VPGGLNKWLEIPVLVFAVFREILIGPSNNQ
jgi:hypothetical protein